MEKSAVNVFNPIALRTAKTHGVLAVLNATGLIVVAVLFYVRSKHLRSCHDCQST